MRWCRPGTITLTAPPFIATNLKLARLLKKFLVVPVSAATYLLPVNSGTLNMLRIGCGKPAKKTLKDLNLEYLDLYLMHWGIAIPPNEAQAANQYGRFTEQLDKDGFLITEPISVRETWQEMEKLVESGLVKAIGVANFTAPMLIDLLSYAKIRPVVNQIELHPYLQQTELIEFCASQNIVVTGYSPLGSPGNYQPKGFPVIAEDPVIVKIAKTHKKSPSQVLIRWGVQRGTVVIPKSITPQRIEENLNVFDFELSDSEMQSIKGLNRNLRFVNSYVWWKIPYFG
jgi:diketogulonate reductase-like aldo/keto reductase